jgi:organic hydroperoxide reductase OsmC/OhrA
MQTRPRAAARSAGINSPNIVTTAEVDLNLSDSGPKLSELRLNVEAIIPDFDDSKLEKAVSKTAESCPVFQLLKPGFDSVKLESRIQR